MNNQLEIISSWIVGKAILFPQTYTILAKFLADPIVKPPCLWRCYSFCLECFLSMNLWGTKSFSAKIKCHFSQSQAEWITPPLLLPYNFIHLILVLLLWCYNYLFICLPLFLDCESSSDRDGFLLRQFSHFSLYPMTCLKIKTEQNVQVNIKEMTVTNTNWTA